MLKKLPLYITWFRVFLIPVLVFAFYLPWSHANWLAFYIFLLAGLSDALDGWLARKFNGASDFGAFFDPIADKLMVCVAMVLISVQYQNVWLTLACAIIIGREVIVSSLREWHAKQGLDEKIKVSIWGKMKTVSQFMSISFLLIGQQVAFIDTVSIGYVLMVFAVLLTLFSMSHYFYLTYQTHQNSQ